MAPEDSWIRRLRSTPAARLRLLCIAHAGGGAWSFRDWPSALPEEIDVWGLQLPGREDRLLEPPLASVTEIIEALMAAGVATALTAPFAVFGHSMGALVGFELLRELRRRQLPGACGLFASAFRAPQFPRRSEALAGLSDEAFIEAVNRRYAAVPREVVESAELRELILPGLRADIAVCDGYRYTAEAPLDCPIVALGGEQDDEVTATELDGWEQQTCGDFERLAFEGGHFFQQTARDQLLVALVERLVRSTS